ncbi:DNA-binding transcriptional regulator, XRE family [Dethiosulfatibacter aminovorans DSM 17477]|uniref:DNA-binding transcriptional regulator, XRE family n=1 Tax=Dethiosulfatibacter aminovorans DSM 17477 TaxID=1121476 RepID=A0A1M6LDP0_9FIRM|nr:helix-turn-helix transcriptional regulator [Dethiosulfatibacter aminovorans]SHJ69262.1 DNA-binding transcriptional regulator, XRE family [Dethiosulfatibacter aminovorans DSM 17477]
MDVSYKRLWKLIIDKDMTNVQVRRTAEISPATFTKLKKNETVSMDILLKLCKVLECQFEDIVEIVREEGEVKL